MTPGSSRNGTSKNGYPGGAAGRHSGMHARERGPGPRKPILARSRWAVWAVPAAVMAATLAAGTAAYGLTGNSQPNPGKLMAALSVPIEQGTVTSAGGGLGKTESSAATKTALRYTAASQAARPHARTTASRPAARPAQSATVQPASVQPVAAPTTAQLPSPSPSASSTASATTVSCSDDSYLLPANVTAIVSFLLANGYSDNAVAGIAGNIYQESKGDPESVGMGGGGLIGFTPLPAGYVTGNPSADLQTQLNAILSYNQIWASYIPALNDADSPADAAYIYVTYFERAGIPAASTREASAEAVAAACNL